MPFSHELQKYDDPPIPPPAYSLRRTWELFQRPDGRMQCRSVGVTWMKTVGREWKNGKKQELIDLFNKSMLEKTRRMREKVGGMGGEGTRTDFDRSFRPTERQLPYIALINKNAKGGVESGRETVEEIAKCGQGKGKGPIPPSGKIHKKTDFGWKTHHQSPTSHPLPDLLGSGNSSLAKLKQGEASEPDCAGEEEPEVNTDTASGEGGRKRKAMKTLLGDRKRMQTGRVDQ